MFISFFSQSLNTKKILNTLMDADGINDIFIKCPHVHDLTDKSSVDKNLMKTEITAFFMDNFWTSHVQPEMCSRCSAMMDKDSEEKILMNLGHFYPNV